MQKAEYPANHHYAQHAVDLADSGWHYGCTDCYDTQYGHTSHCCKLELHVGDHLYRKRGGANGAFHTDSFDCRYESLALSLGVSIEPDKMIGALLGNSTTSITKASFSFAFPRKLPPMSSTTGSTTKTPTSALLNTIRLLLLFRRTESGSWLPSRRLARTPTVRLTSLMTPSMTTSPTQLTSMVCTGTTSGPIPTLLTIASISSLVSSASAPNRNGRGFCFFCHNVLKCLRPLGIRQVVRQWVLVPPFGGSNPSSPATKNKNIPERVFFVLRI